MIEILSYNSDIGWDEWWRPLLYMFAHANVFHLAANALCLFLVIKQTKRYFPVYVTIPIIYITCVLSTFLMPKGIDVVGVSAGIYGVIGMWVVSAMSKRTIEIHNMKKFLLSCLYFVVPTLVIGILHPVSLHIHLVGFILGGLTISVFYFLCELFSIKAIKSWKIKR